MTKEYIRVIIKSDYLFITVIPFVISTKFPLYITISNIRYIETSDRIADYITTVLYAYCIGRQENLSQKKKLLGDCRYEHEKTFKTSDSIVSCSHHLRLFISP